MTGRLDHEPSRIIQQLIVDLELGSLVGGNEEWPVFNSVMPDGESVNEEAIAVTSTTGAIQGKLQVTGETVERYGFQVRVRASDVSHGYLKIKRIFDEFSELLDEQVVLDLDTYSVYAISMTSTVIHLGLERGSRRRNWTFNAVAAIRLTASAGSGS